MRVRVQDLDVTPRRFIQSSPISFCACSIRSLRPRRTSTTCSACSRSSSALPASDGFANAGQGLRFIAGIFAGRIDTVAEPGTAGQAGVAGESALGLKQNPVEGREAGRRRRSQARQSVRISGVEGGGVPQHAGHFGAQPKSGRLCGRRWVVSRFHPDSG